MKRIALYLLFLIVLAVGVSANPVLNAISDQAVNEGDVLTFTIMCSAPDNGSIAFADDAGFGTLTKINNTAATFTWSPGFSDAGVYNVTFTANDANSSNSKSMLITVNDITSTDVLLPNVNLGSSSQDRDEIVTATFTVQNTGSTTLTGISITSSADSEYNVTFQNVPTTLAPNASHVVTVNAYVPEDKDSGSEKIGQVTFTANSGALVKISDLSMNAKSEIEITDLDIERNDGEDSESLDDGDTYDPAKRGDKLTFTVEVKNTFSDNIELDDVNVNIYNDDLDWDEDEDISGISDGKKETVEISVDIDDDVDADTYEVEILVEAEDENGAMHSDKWIIDIEIDQETHEITITDAYLEPATVSCSDRQVKLKVELWNSGKRDEDEVSIKVKADDLGFLQRDLDLEIEEDEDLTKTYYITIPATLGQGSYLVEIFSYYDNDDESDYKALTLVVPNCGSASSPADDEDEEEEDDAGVDNTVITPGTPDGATSPSQYYQVSYGEKDKTGLFSEESMMLILLGLGIVLVLIIIIILVAKHLI